MGLTTTKLAMAHPTMTHHAIVFGPPIALIEEKPISIQGDVNDFVQAEFFKGRYVTTRVFDEYEVFTSDSALLDMMEPRNDFAPPIRGPIVVVFKVDEKDGGGEVNKAKIHAKCVEPIYKETQEALSQPSFQLFSMDGECTTSEQTLADEIIATFGRAKKWAIHGDVNA